MEKKVILLDLDDTLNKFNTKLWETYNKLYNDNVNYQDVNDWNLSAFAKNMDNPSDLFKKPGIFRYVDLKDYAKEFVSNLRKNFEVYFVTDSPPGTSHCEVENGEIFSNPADDKRKWVEDNFPGFPQKNIIICGTKHMVYGDVLVDDKPDTYYKYKELGREIILMDAPYNRHIKTNDRVKNLKEAENLIYSKILNMS